MAAARGRAAGAAGLPDRRRGAARHAVTDGARADALHGITRGSRHRRLRHAGRADRCGRRRRPHRAHEPRARANGAGQGARDRGSCPHRSLRRHSHRRHGLLPLQRQSPRLGLPRVLHRPARPGTAGRDSRQPGGRADGRRARRGGDVGGAGAELCGAAHGSDRGLACPLPPSARAGAARMAADHRGRAARRGRRRRVGRASRRARLRAGGAHRQLDLLRAGAESDLDPHDAAGQGQQGGRHPACRTSGHARAACVPARARDPGAGRTLRVGPLSARARRGATALTACTAAECPAAVHRGSRSSLHRPHDRGPPRHAVSRRAPRRQRHLRAVPLQRRADVSRAVRVAVLGAAASGRGGHEGALRERLSLPAHAADARRLSHADGHRPESRSQPLATRPVHGAQRRRRADRRERLSTQRAAHWARRHRRGTVRSPAGGNRRAPRGRASVFPHQPDHRHSPSVRGADDPS